MCKIHFKLKYAIYATPLFFIKRDFFETFESPSYWLNVANLLAFLCNSDSMKILEERVHAFVGVKNPKQCRDVVVH